MTTKDSGCGILPDFESKEFQRWWNEADKREEQQRKEAAAEEAREAALQRLYDSIDANLSPHLKAELAAENETARVTPKQKADFAAFRSVQSGECRICPQCPRPSLYSCPKAIQIPSCVVVNLSPQFTVQSANPTPVKTC